MKPSLGLRTLFLCLACTSIAAAQTSPLPPLPSCSAGVHEGIAKADADLAVEIVCGEIRRRSPSNRRSYLVQFIPTGKQYTLILAEVNASGTILRQHSRLLENIHATYREAPVLVNDTLGEEESAEQNDPAAKREWYGWQTVALDGSAMAMTAVFLSHSSYQRSNTLLYVAGTTYCFGAPMVHLANGHPGKAALSLGMRGLALGGAAIIVGGLEHSNDMGEAVFKVLVGLPLLAVVLGTPMGIDGAFAENKVAPARPSVQWNLSPTIGRSSGGLSFAGSF